jgi:chromosomal replication initiator protein
MTYHDLALANVTLGIAPPPAVVSVRPKLSVQRIQEVVARYYDISVSHMTLPTRHWSVSHPRQTAMYLSRKLIRHGIKPISYPDIGRKFGDRDHTTVIYAMKAVEQRMADDWEYRAEVEYLRERLEA